MTAQNKISCLSDAELIKLLRESDHVAFTEIYRRYARLLFVHAYKKLQDEEQAKDIIQELFTSLWHKREIADIDGTTLRSYLYVSTRNRVFNLFSHQKVESKYIQSLHNYIASENTASPDYLIRENELTAYIDKGIQALPPKMRAIFELSRKEQLNNKEIALKLNVTESNVSKQVSNAVRILKTKLSIVIFIYLLISP